MDINFRFATAEDAPAFARWVAENQQIDAKDKLAATKEANATTTFLVLEIDGIPRLFIPMYMVLRIGYLGFNPENTGDQNKEAMEAILPYLKEFARIWKVNEIDTLTRESLPVAQWAAAHGFAVEPRQLFTLRVDPAKNNPSPEEGLVQ